MFVVSLVDGIIPSFRVVDTEKEEEKALEEERLAEERRILYVAMSRAKKELYLSNFRKDRICRFIHALLDKDIISKAHHDVSNQQLVSEFEKHLQTTVHPNRTFKKRTSFDESLQFNNKLPSFQKNFAKENSNNGTESSKRQRKENSFTEN